MEVTGSRNVSITGLDDEREITAVFGGAADGSFLPPQLIYAAKTDRSHPQGDDFPPSWHITHNDNHWSNEETMIAYFVAVIKPYKEQTIQRLGLDLQKQKMVVLFDVFRAHLVDSCKQWLSRNNIEFVCIPPNTTDKLQLWILQ